ncbi:MAG: HlyD family type I secretion periplasmic adaptor subunit [Pseudomonadota bacterium]
MIAAKRRKKARPEETSPEIEQTVRARRTIAVACVAFATLIAIAGTFDIREIAFADGHMVPPRNAMSVEHLEGGRISGLFVEAGDEVMPGTVLARLDALDAATNLGVLETQYSSMALERERLRALITQTDPSFARYSTNPDALAEQQALLDAERSAITSMKAAVETEIEELDAQITAAERQVGAAGARVDIAGRRADMRQNVFERGHNSEDQVLEARALLEIARTEMTEAEREVALARHRRASALSDLDREYAEAMRGWIARRTEVSQELASLEQKIVLSREQLNRVNVVAPIRGIIQNIVPSGRGAILRPGDQLLTIVPLGAVALAEVRLTPRDIGHVREGDRATLTVDTFHEKRFGTLDARVETISATTFNEDEGEPYYRLRLAIEGGDFAQQLRPGMTVQARISTGAKSLLSYFLDPILHPLSKAFSER